MERPNEEPRFCFPIRRPHGREVNVSSEHNDWSRGRHIRRDDGLRETVQRDGVRRLETRGLDTGRTVLAAWIHGPTRTFPLRARLDCSR